MESLTRPAAHMNKKSKGSGGVASSKTGYDDVFSAPEAVQRFKAPAGVEDYSEIFGGGSRGSSIPVLDLSALDERTESYRTSKVDYNKVFGGFEDDLAVPYEELLKGGVGNSKLSKIKARNHSEKKSPPQGADTCNLAGNSEEPPSKASNPSLDAMKQFNMSYLKTSQENKSQPNGTTHVAKLHAVPGFTYFVNEPPSKQKTESGMHKPPIKGEVHRTWSFSGNVPDENNRNTEMLLPGKLTAKGSSGAKSGSWQVGSQSKDRSFNNSESDLKSQSFRTAPSPNNFLESRGIRGHPKRSKSSNISSKANPFEKFTSNGTEGSSDEELDINSDAAACAAALKRVLEKAQESIRLAKEIRERGEKNGIQRFSNLSSEHNSSKVKDNKNEFDKNANNSKKQNVKDRHERLGSELDEYKERNNGLGSRSPEVSTPECSQEPLMSTEAAEGKSQLNIAKANGRSKSFLELVDTGKNTAPTLVLEQVQMDKSSAFLSIRKEESEAPKSMKQESAAGETTTAETTEQRGNNSEIEKSMEKDFGIGNAENNMHIDEQTRVSEVTNDASDSAHISYEFSRFSMEKDFGIGNAENNMHVDEQTRVSEVTNDASDSAYINYEFRRSEGLEITEKDARSEDMKCMLDELKHCEIILPECLDMSEGKKLDPSKTKDQHMLEWQNLAKEEVPSEDFQQVQLELQFVYSHSQEERENGLYSCKGGGMVHQEACSSVASGGAPEVCGSGIQGRAHKDSREGDACGTSNELVSSNEGMLHQEAFVFVESDDASEVCGSGNIEKTHEDSQETVACGTSNGLDSCNEGGVVQQDTHVFMVSDDAQEVYGSRSWERTHKDSHEGEACVTSDSIQEMGVDESELISDHEGEEASTVPCEEHEKTVVEDLGPNEEKLVQVLHEEKCTNVLKEEHWEGEDQKISEKMYNQVKVDENAFEEEYDWGEVEKRIKKGCTIVDTEETTGVHEENDNFDNNEQIDLLQKAAYEKNFDPDIYVSLHDLEESQNTGVVEEHEPSNSTTGTSEDFYNCEWEGSSEEETLKPCDFTKLDEKSDFAQGSFEVRVSSSGTPGPFMAVEPDDNGTNANHNSLSGKHNLPQENVLESTYFIQDAENDINIRFALHLSKDQEATNIDFSAGSQGTVTDKNVKDPEPTVNCKSGDDFLHRFRENSEHVSEEFSFDKEDDVDLKVVRNDENKEKVINETISSAVTHQATIKQESVEEVITGQNIHFVRSTPQKNALPEDNEARVSSQNDLKEKENSRKIEAMKRERERDKDRIAVERTIREVRERAFAEAKERAERAAVARAGAEVRQRMMAEAREKLEKDTAGTKLADKASIEAKQRAERAAVERATAEARERALEKALSHNTTFQGRVQTAKLSGTSKDSALKHSLSSSDLETFDGNNSESAQRRKARLESHERIMERAAKALAEKNMRDLQTQKEQAERNRLAESLDADVKRWANGKEKNLRALLSTLQYILGPDSGWQPISLTEIITTAAVKKAYRKATLCVHPDKLQQRGASIQQKYICEKVFDLLKASWNKFNSEER